MGSTHALAWNNLNFLPVLQYLFTNTLILLLPITTDSLSPLPCIWKVSSLNLNTQTSYPEVVHGFTKSLQENSGNYTLKYDMTTSIHIISIPSSS